VSLRQADILKDFHRKAADVISRNHVIVHAEDLKILNMTRSASGALENH
jgi:hypothetical protein